MHQGIYHPNLVDFDQPKTARNHSSASIVSAFSPVQFQGTVQIQAEGKPPLITSRQEGPVRYLSMNHTDRKNALSSAMFHSLSKAFTEAEADPQTKTIVLESAMDNMFSPGADLKPLFEKVQAIGTTWNKKLAQLPKVLRRPIIRALQFKQMYALCIDGHQLMSQVAQSQKTTIAWVEGMAIGGGVELALACDYILASPNARFAVPELKYRIFPDWGATERLPQRVGPTMAKFLILEGGLMEDRGMSGPATLTAEEAHRIGLVEQVVDQEVSKDGKELGQIISQAHKNLNSSSEGVLEKRDWWVRKRLEGSSEQSESRLLKKFDRYRAASLFALKRDELKTLYLPALEVALRRINNAPFVGNLKSKMGAEWQHRLDLIKLIQFAQTQPKQSD